jgi:uncharacterized protein YjbI with pentapeptide repeats
MGWIGDVLRAPVTSTIIAGILGGIAPLTAWVNARAKIKLQEQAQQHKIITGYLDRALDPEVPLAIRQQLLRFLSTSGGRQIENWAMAELRLVDAVVEGLDGAIEDAEKARSRARNPQSLRDAERRLAEAVRHRRSAGGMKVRPPPSAAALKAGYYASSERSMIGIDMRGKDLEGASLAYANLQGSTFADAKLRGASFQGADLRAADMSGADLVDARFYEADARAAKFRNSDLRGADFHKARLHGVDFSGAQLEHADLRATYDDATVWPAGFDPAVAGAVLSDGKDLGPPKLDTMQESTISSELEPPLKRPQTTG